jgi:hypothetical protein
MLVTGLFLLWGIPNNLNDVLIRQFMKSFEITRFKAGLVQSAFYTGYFLFSIPAAMVMKASPCASSARRANSGRGGSRATFMCRSCLASLLVAKPECTRNQAVAMPFGARQMARP